MQKRSRVGTVALVGFEHLTVVLPEARLGRAGRLGWAAILGGLGLKLSQPRCLGGYYISR